MKHIDGFEKAESILGQFAFNEFNVIRKLSLEASAQSAVAHDLFLTIESVKRKTNYSMNLRFIGVSGLKINFLGGLIKITGFDIVDISTSQWEGLNWEISDFEDGLLNFYCQNIAIVSTVKI